MSTTRKTLWAAVVIVLVALTFAGARFGGFLPGGGLQPTALIPAYVAAAVALAGPVMAVVFPDFGDVTRLYLVASVDLHKTFTVFKVGAT